MTNFDREIERFKEWAVGRESTYGEWECDYENWHDLWEASEETMRRYENESPSDEASSKLLYVIARDNELERLRNTLVEYPGLLRHLASIAHSCPEPDAKWQIAVSIADAQLPEAADLIRPFLTDSSEYVRRRSLLAIAPFSPSEAEEIAKDWMTEEYEYSRIAGLHVLNIVNSEELPLYLKRHEKDCSQHVRSNVDEIRRQRIKA
ncbi:HEAT repeat domain-containing protein [Marinobacter profundi]|uniref:HEAT repeat domain-containing protein n=1 Tax=Marinobacter profundi TaxID=2666256 RepID=UPI00117C709B|nr:HEAT repeat domain-containing protein [Marinobacter profundi]